MSQPAAQTYTEAPMTLRDRFDSYTGPPQLMAKAIYYFFLTILSSPLLIVRDFTTFRHKAFARLWAEYGQAMSEEMPDGIKPIVATVGGVVLDVGPGSGTQSSLFDSSKITKVYGVEPAVDLHSELLRNADKAGLGDKYVAIAAGAEPHSLIPALAKMGLLQSSAKDSSGIFDTIVCIRVLCGVPQQEQTIEGLYRLLKPGGRFIVCEHVVQPYPNGGDVIAKFFQNLYMLLGWWFWLGGCCLDRDTEKVLRDVAGPNGWKKINLKFLGPQATIPYIVGELVKSG